MSDRDDDNEGWNTGFPLFLGVSLLVHALFFASVLLMPDLGVKRGEILPVITVDLVSLSVPENPGGGSDEPEMTAPRPPEKKKNTKAKVVVKKKNIVKKKKPAKIKQKKIVRKIKKKTVRRKIKNSARVIDSAMERLKKKVDRNEREEPVNAMEQALSRLKKKVAGGEQALKSTPETRVDPLKQRLDALKFQNSSSGEVFLPGRGKPGSEAGGRPATIEDVYRHNVAAEVKNAWAFPEYLAGGVTGLLTEVSFDVLPGGELADIRLVIKSGNKYLDESALNAVRKATPFAPHLTGISKSVVRVRVHFTP